MSLLSLYRLTLALVFRQQLNFPFANRFVSITNICDHIKIITLQMRKNLCTFLSLFCSFTILICLYSLKHMVDLHMIIIMNNKAEINFSTRFFTIWTFGMNFRLMISLFLLFSALLLVSWVEKMSRWWLQLDLTMEFNHIYDFVM